MKIDVAIVTFNRLEKLKKALDAFDKQSILPGKIVVVNNGCTDGTDKFLKDWSSKKSKYERIVINLETNTGGSGGFAAGTKYLLDHKSDWIWVSDDDAYPDKDAFKIATEYLENNDLKDVSAICSTVVKNDGNIDYGHRRTIKRGLFRIKFAFSKPSDYEKETFDIDVYSYVGAIMNAKKMKKVGIINKDFFIYQDDADHSLRMRKEGRIICIPSIKVTHDVVEANVDNSVYTWKTYYLHRNCLFLYKYHFPKRFLYVEMFLIKLRIIKKHNRECTKLLNTAIKDFKNNKLGVHELYKPGWKIGQK